MKIRKILWIFHRFRAMSLKEILWRLEQKYIETLEEKCFKENRKSVIDHIFEDNLIKYKNTDNPQNIGLNFKNNKFSTNQDIWLFNKYSYNKFKNKWHAGFNTNNNWPKEFSYNLEYKQNDVIGDARTNWELNRHFQFTILAKNFYITKEEKYLNELQTLFYQWNLENPFLIGISWTSVMEVAIRAYSWLITLCFLRISENVEEKFVEDLKIGILNMTDYVNKHHSKYSSANNHLLVEMFTLCTVGIVFNNEEWVSKSIRILDKELFLQNYQDGVNKEHALHYQTFVMEAMALVMLVLKRNNFKYPDSWNILLGSMSEYISDNMDCYEEVSHLGDSDEGKLLDLSGLHYNHFKYVLQLSSCLLKKQYVCLKELHENINWLFVDEEINSITEIYNNKISKTYKLGGYTILKNNENYENEVLITIDHAELGFGSIAAHGHADSLSFTMTVNGNKVFIDPGTYIYHIDLPMRNYFRKTINHNTLCINNRNQSQMLGAFLWGKRANSLLLESNISSESDYIAAQHDGYKPIIHKRTYQYNKTNKLEIIDYVSGQDFLWANTFIIDNEVKIKEFKDDFIILETKKNLISLKTDKNYKFILEDIEISKVYGTKISSKAIRVYGESKKNLILKVEIEIL